MNYLIDTSAYSLGYWGEKTAVHFFQIADRLLISPIALGELRHGALIGTKREANEAGLQRFLSEHRVQVVNIDEETSFFYAQVKAATGKKGTTVAANDLWIAASAMQHGLCILTADTDFQKIPQVLVELITSESV